MTPIRNSRDSGQVRVQLAVDRPRQVAVRTGVTRPRDPVTAQGQSKVLPLTGLDQGNDKGICTPKATVVFLLSDPSATQLSS